MRNTWPAITRLMMLPLLAMLAALAYAEPAQEAGSDEFGIWQRRIRPHQYGNVKMDNFSSAKQEKAVVFRHWSHRSKYTCRLCHVDIGFGMGAGETGMDCQDNKAGLYCGSCHNGKESFGLEEDKQGVKTCGRCHVGEDPDGMREEFARFKTKFRKERFGNGIDWQSAETYKRITLKDQLPGISIKRAALTAPKEASFRANQEMMPDIIFSHQKHAAWSGCELCHPSIFGVKLGADRYSMEDIFKGRYCGECHNKVAFPLLDCRRCHSREVY